MRFLEKFSTGIFNKFTKDASSQSREIKQILNKGTGLVDEQTLNEIKAWVIAQQTVAGGFPNRGGEDDLYYTLFGFFLAEALRVDSIMPTLKDFVKNRVKQQKHSGIDLFCLAILQASLFGDEPATRELKRKIKHFSKNPAMASNGYFRFLVILSLLYLHDRAGAWRVLKSVGRNKNETGSDDAAIGKPCPVVVAEQILAFMKSGKTDGLTAPLMAFYRGNGGFAALTKAPAPDLLSTAVALFAMQFMRSDLNLIRIDCLNFVDGLYHNGGFRAGYDDTQEDVEYAFYGLLALGALSSN